MKFILPVFFLLSNTVSPIKKYIKNVRNIKTPIRFSNYNSSCQKKESFLYSRFGGVKAQQIFRKISCSFKNFNTPLFDIELINLPHFVDEKFAKEIFNWFMKNVFYSNEIYTLEKIIFDGRYDGPNYGFYGRNKIYLYPNGKTFWPTKKNSTWSFSKTSLKYLGKKSLNAYDPEVWAYPLSHEYGHHQAKIYLSDGEYEPVDYNLYDITLNEEGKKFFELLEYNKLKEVKDISSVKGLKKGSYKKGKNLSWPFGDYSKKYNYYLFTKSEMITRALQGLTFGYPISQYDDKNKALYPIGWVPLNDFYWWNYYGYNPYQRNTVGSGYEFDTIKIKKIFSNKFVPFFENIYFHKNEPIIKTIVIDNDLFIIANNSNLKISVQNNSKQVFTLQELPKKNNLFLNVIPLVNGEKIPFKINNGIYKISNLDQGVYQILIDGKKVTDKEIGI